MDYLITFIKKIKKIKYIIKKKFYKKKKKKKKKIILLFWNYILHLKKWYYLNIFFKIDDLKRKYWICFE